VVIFCHTAGCHQERQEPGLIEKRLVCIGKVAKVHGVKGELKLFAYSGEAAGLCGYEELYLASEQTAVVSFPERQDATGMSMPPAWYRIIRCRPQGKYTLVVLEGVEHRDAAQSLVGFFAHVDEKALAPLGDDEFYWHKLQGLSVVTEEGDNIGRVSSLFSNGAQDVLVVKDKGREYYIPATKEFITGIDPVAKEITVALVPGLLEING
jgi:16S rRNA processing protein RimM